MLLINVTFIENCLNLLSVKYYNKLLYVVIQPANVCGVCFQRIKTPMQFLMQCGHTFCNTCWLGHVLVQLENGIALGKIDSIYPYSSFPFHIRFHIKVVKLKKPLYFSSYVFSVSNSFLSCSVMCFSSCSGGFFFICC